MIVRDVRDEGRSERGWLYCLPKCREVRVGGSDLTGWLKSSGSLRQVVEEGRKEREREGEREVTMTLRGEMVLRSC